MKTSYLHLTSRFVIIREAVLRHPREHFRIGTEIYRPLFSVFSLIFAKRENFNINGRRTS